jgi:Xaa-Pro aminopeptidase
LLLLERSGRTTLLGDNFAIRAAAAEPFVDREIVETWYDHQHAVKNRDHALFGALKQIVPDISGKPGLVEAEWLPLGAASVLGLDAAQFSLMEDTVVTVNRELGTILRQLRRRKEEDELSLIRESVKAGEAGMSRLREVLRAGMSEMEVYLEVQRAALGAVNRPGLVYGDFRATYAEQPKLGGLPSGRIIQKVDLFILDYSVVLNGYRADFTNTLAVGPPSKEAQELFAVCEAGMASGEKALKAGARASDVHAATVAPYAASGKPAFTHHAGHGVGLAHPEPPILVRDSTDVLVAGDVITLEPGAYVEGVGGMRIERNYLITESGYETLTQHVISLT